jgi:hypothetical protein
MWHIAQVQPSQSGAGQPTPEAERIPMVDFTTTQARVKGAAPSVKGATKTPSALPSPTVDGVDRMYHQLAEIHPIAAAQEAECAR